MDLTNSKRLIPKASYVITELTPDEQQRVAHTSGRALAKVNYLRALALQRGELSKLEQSIARTENPSQRREFEQLFSICRTLLEQGESVIPVSLGSSVSKVSDLSLIEFAKLAEPFKRSTVEPLIAAYQQMQKVSPVGRLHLERLEMYPVGIEQGEMMFTVPLAPAETCTISHKEWSTSTDEYQDIVDDFFESYSERGVAEKSDVSLSSENEARHSLALTFGASVSGGYGPVSVSTNFGLTSTSEERNSIKHSAQESQEITQKASARTRQEHKVSMKLETKKGVDDSSFRTVTNTFPDRALRVDYFRMMRKWRCDLYRYGLRLTYDLAIPDPGARLWTKYRELAALDRQLRTPFTFSVKPVDITGKTRSDYAVQYGASLDAPPASQILTVWKPLTNVNGGMEAFEFVAPFGYVLGPHVKGHGTISDGDVSHVSFTAELVSIKDLPSSVGQGFEVRASDALFEANRSTVFVTYAANVNAMIELETAAGPSAELLESWRMKAWQTLYSAAFEQYKQQLQILQDRRDRLFSDLINKDTLTLRRLEREELIRLVMDWILGPSFTTSPATVSNTIQSLLTVEGTTVGPAPSDLQSLTPAQWADARMFGEFVKFVHEAVEWENMLYFLYPYFWGSSSLAKEKLLFDHADSTHRDFLRAGYARIVIPIRPGFEADFTRLVETGTFSGTASSPYMTIAQEIEAFAKTNYAGIPPANPEKHSRPLLFPQQRTTWSTMEKVIALIEQFKVDNGHYPAKLSELAGAPFEDAWGRELVYVIPGSGNDYDLISYGADGEPGGEDLNADISAGAGASLMASWFDYTPTSGLDIELTAKPALVA